jgi:hypothetical protein
VFNFEFNEVVKEKLPDPTMSESLAVEKQKQSSMFSSSAGHPNPTFMFDLYCMLIGSISWSAMTDNSIHFESDLLTKGAKFWPTAEAEG